MMVRGRSGWWAAALVAVASGCQAPSAGGQSGTDADTSSACPRIGERPVGFDEATSLGSAAELRASAERALAQSAAIPLRWTQDVGGTTTLSIEAREWGTQAIFVESAVHGCDALLVPATLRFVTADGLLDETIAGTFSGLQWIGGYDADAVEQSAISQRLAMILGRADLELEQFGVIVSWGDRTFVDQGIVTARGRLQAVTALDVPTVSDALYSLAEFDSTWPAGVAIGEHYEPPRAFAEACGAADPVEWGFTAFSSDDALIKALTGSWVLCTSTFTNAAPHDGMVLTADGTWRHLIERDGRLIERLGFEHEGSYSVIDTSDINGRNARQLDIERFPQNYSFSDDRRTLQLVQGDASTPRHYDNTYVRTAVPIAPANPRRAIGERAGAAACEEGEAFVHGFDTIDDLLATLTGSWVFCRGGFREGASGLAFAADGTYRHLDAAGATLATGHYVLVDTSSEDSAESAGATQVNMTDDDAPADRLTRVYVMVWPLLSDAPLKLWVGDEARSVLSAQP